MSIMPPTAYVQRDRSVLIAPDKRLNGGRHVDLVMDHCGDSPNLILERNNNSKIR